MGKRSAAKPPASLSLGARSWWRRIQKDFVVDDEAGLLVLETALLAFDRMEAARKLIDAEGSVVKDRFGQPRAHPAVVIERDARSAMLTGLRQLNLDVEPARRLGRPIGGREDT